MQRLFFAGNRPRAECGIMPFLVPPHARKIQKNLQAALRKKEVCLLYAEIRIEAEKQMEYKLDE